MQLGMEGSWEPPLRPSASEEEPSVEGPAPPSPPSPPGAGAPSALTTVVCTLTQPCSVSSWISRRNWLCYWSPVGPGIQGSGDPLFTDRRLQPVDTPNTRGSQGSPLVTMALGQPRRRVSGDSWKGCGAEVSGALLPSVLPDVTARLSPDWSPSVHTHCAPHRWQGWGLSWG